VSRGPVELATGRDRAFSDGEDGDEEPGSVGGTSSRFFCTRGGEGSDLLLRFRGSGFFLLLSFEAFEPTTCEVVRAISRSVFPIPGCTSSISFATERLLAGLVCSGDAGDWAMGSR
jgi:hypothetical protein